MELSGGTLQRIKGNLQAIFLTPNPTRNSCFQNTSTIIQLRSSAELSFIPGISTQAPARILREFYMNFLQEFVPGSLPKFLLYFFSESFLQLSSRVFPGFPQLYLLGYFLKMFVGFHLKLHHRFLSEFLPGLLSEEIDIFVTQYVLIEAVAD